MSNVRQHFAYAVDGKPSQEMGESKAGGNGKPSDQWSKTSLIDGKITPDQNTCDNAGSGAPPGAIRNNW